MDARDRQLTDEKLRKDLEEPRPYFCPDCGAQPVVYRPNRSDYYEGDSFLCKVCGFEFVMHSYGI
jgi:predicted RNA-binding Zn-ribbon protein involved in translation (DUF1610 family)